MARRRKTLLSQLWADLGLTGAEVAHRAGIKQTHLYEVARGVKTPSMEVAAALSEVLQTPVEVLFPHAFEAGRRRVEEALAERPA